jgi:hypothetical protein
MSNGRSELFIFLGVAFATAIGLFVANRLYATYIDRKYHAELAERAPHEAVLAAREEEQKLFAQGKMPLEQAMQRLSERGRAGFVPIAPAASEDLSPISGWIHRPGFKPVAAHPIRTPRAPAVVAPPPEAAEPAPAEPAPAAKQPKRRQAP